MADVGVQPEFVCSLIMTRKRVEGKGRARKSGRLVSCSNQQTDGDSSIQS